jgi:transposase
MTSIYLGNDISKGYLDACFLNDAGHRLAPSGRYDDTPQGHAALATALADLAARAPDVTFVVGLEASGGLERNWLRFFRQNPHTAPGSLYRLNPLAVRRFLERELHRSVTDAASAHGIATYLRGGLRRADQPYAPEREGPVVFYRWVCNSIDRQTQLQNELQCLLPAVHPDLVEYARAGCPEWLLRLLEKYPTSATLARARPATLARLPYLTLARAETLLAAAKQSVAGLQDAHTGRAVTLLAREIRRLGAQIARDKAALIAELRSDPVVRRLETIVGIGWWTAVVLRLEIGNFDRFPEPAALVAYAGLDPSYHQSGDGLVQFRISKRGRAEIRAALYMNVLTAVQHNPAIRACYRRLVDRGKLPAVALTACMGKLLRIAYACVIHEEDFDRERYLVAPAAPAQQATGPSPSGQADVGEKDATGPAPAGPAAPVRRVTAPVTRREAQRRRAAAGPQGRRTGHERGPGAAGEKHVTGDRAGVASSSTHEKRP